MEHQLAFDQETRRAAAGVVDLHPRLGVHDPGHDEADLGGGVEFARALASALGKLADQVFVAAPDDVGLHVGQTQALGADRLDQGGEAVVVEVADAVGGGVEVHAVDDPLEKRVGVGNGAQIGRQPLAQLRQVRVVGLALGVVSGADDRPDGVVGVLRREGQVEADKLLVASDQVEGLGAGADLLGDAVELVVEDVAEALGEDEREDELLVFGCILGAADGAGGVPNPGFEGFAVAVFAVGSVGHVGFLTFRSGISLPKHRENEPVRLPQLQKRRGCSVKCDPYFPGNTIRPQTSMGGNIGIHTTDPRKRQTENE